MKRLDFDHPDQIELEEIDFNFLPSQDDTFIDHFSSSISSSYLDYQSSPVHHEDSPILKNRLFSSYRTFDNSPIQKEFYRDRDILYESPSHNFSLSEIDGNKFYKLWHLKKQQIYQLDHNKNNPYNDNKINNNSDNKINKNNNDKNNNNVKNLKFMIWTRILSFIEFTELLQIRLTCKKMNKFFIQTPLSLDHIHLDYAMTDKMLKYNVTKIKIRTIEDWCFYMKYSSKLYQTLNHLIIWVRNDSFSEIQEKFFSFLKNSSLLEIIELRYLYNKSIIDYLKQINSLKKLHLNVQNAGEIELLWRDLSHLELDLNIEWCSPKELELFPNLNISRISIPCFVDLFQSQSFSIGTNCPKVQFIHGKCFSIKHFLLFFHYFPNATDQLEWCGSISKESDQQDLSEEEALIIIEEKIINEAKKIKIPKKTIKRLKNQFENIYEGNLDIWETLISIIDSLYSSK